MLTGKSCTELRTNARDLWVEVKVSAYTGSFLFFLQENKETKTPLAGKLVFKAMLKEKKFSTSFIGENGNRKEK